MAAWWCWAMRATGPSLRLQVRVRLIAARTRPSRSAHPAAAGGSGRPVARVRRDAGGHDGGHARRQRRGALGRCALGFCDHIHDLGADAPAVHEAQRGQAPHLCIACLVGRQIGVDHCGRWPLQHRHIGTPFHPFTQVRELAHHLGIEGGLDVRIVGCRCHARQLPVCAWRHRRWS